MEKGVNNGHRLRYPGGRHRDKNVYLYAAGSTLDVSNHKMDECKESENLTVTVSKGIKTPNTFLEPSVIKLT